jgi:hypothetical protein
MVTTCCHGADQEIAISSLFLRLFNFKSVFLYKKSNFSANDDSFAIFLLSLQHDINGIDETRSICQTISHRETQAGALLVEL